MKQLQNKVHRLRQAHASTWEDAHQPCARWARRRRTPELLEEIESRVSAALESEVEERPDDHAALRRI